MCLPFAAFHAFIVSKSKLAAGATNIRIILDLRQIATRVAYSPLNDIVVGC